MHLGIHLYEINVFGNSAVRHKFVWEFSCIQPEHRPDSGCRFFSGLGWLWEQRFGPWRHTAAQALSGRRFRRAAEAAQDMTHHFFRGSFSAVSTPIFASVYAFFSIFRDLQENHFLASKSPKFLQNFCKFWQVLQTLQTFANFLKKIKNLEKKL